MFAGEHAGDFLDAAFAVEAVDIDSGSAGVYLLLHFEVEVAAARHLGKVGHGQDLAAGGESLELAADDRRLGAADAGVHFVEHEGRPLGRTAAPNRGLKRQEQARQLAARSDPGQRPRILPRFALNR